MLLACCRDLPLQTGRGLYDGAQWFDVISTCSACLLLSSHAIVKYIYKELAGKLRGILILLICAQSVLRLLLFPRISLLHWAGPIALHTCDPRRSLRRRHPA